MNKLAAILTVLVAAGLVLAGSMGRAPSDVSARGHEPSPQSPQIIGRTAGPSLAVATAVVDGRSYAVMGAGSALWIVDISGHSKPKKVGEVLTPGVVRGVAVSGNLALVADGDEGLRVIDVSDPTAPREIGSVDTPGSARGVTVSGNLALVADGGWGLRVIDIADPTAPRETGSVDTSGFAYGVTVSGNLAMVADGSRGLRVIDISDPTAPRETGSVDTPGFAYGVAVSGNLALVAHGNEGLRVIDVSGPTAPRDTGSVDTPGFAWGVAVSGNLALVADAREGLRVIDISDPATPHEAGSVGTPGSARGVAMSGNLALVADGEGGLRVIDISDPTAPRETGSVDTSGFAYGVAVSGNLAMVADGSRGLRVIDVSDPTAPREIGFMDTRGSARGVVVSGNLALVADWSKDLRVLDITDPTAPRETGFVDTPGFARDVTVSGNLALVADGNEGLRVIDISDPTAPRETGSVDTPGFAMGVAVSGSLALVADGYGGLIVVALAPLPTATPTPTASETPTSVAVAPAGSTSTPTPGPGDDTGGTMGLVLAVVAATAAGGAGLTGLGWLALRRRRRGPRPPTGGVAAEGVEEVPSRGEVPPVPTSASPVGAPFFPQELTDVYQGEEYVGEGGYSRVYRAYSIDRKRVVAVKTPKSFDRRAGRTFLREVEVWRGLEHPNIVRLFDANVFPVPYLEIEYVDGGSLDDLPRPVAQDMAGDLVLRVCQGLLYAHQEKGYIHGDVNPRNILLTRRGEPKLTDWGLARPVGYNPFSSGSFRFGYQTPEHLQQARIDFKTDVYQVGVLLYELVTGQLPLDLDLSDEEEVRRRVIEDVPLPPSNLDPSLKPLDDLVLRCLAKEKEERPSVRDICRVLARNLSISLDGLAVESERAGDRRKAAVHVLQNAATQARGGDTRACISALKNVLRYLAGRHDALDQVGDLINVLRLYEDQDVPPIEQAFKIQDLWERLDRETW